VGAAIENEFVLQALAMVDAARATPMIERRSRLMNRARQYIASLVYWEANWFRSEPHPRRLELTDEEREALCAQDRKAWVLTPQGPIVHRPRQSMHKAERVAKRWQQRNARRHERRDGVAALRAIVASTRGHGGA
jgi:hypothetical protein